MYQFEYASPIGALRLTSTGEALSGLYFEGHRPDPKLVAGIHDDAPFRDVVEQLQAFFAGERSSFQLVTSLAGTEFQLSVWNALRDIPVGQRRTYADIAKQIGRPGAARAVGAAVGRNPISIVIPCHRVVGGNGKLTGFAGGIDRKQWLLDHEQLHTRPMLSA